MSPLARRSILCRVQEFVQSLLQHGHIFELALPDGEDVPARVLQQAALLGVAVPRPGAFGFPELGVGLGGVLPHPTVVEVPEATVDEDDFVAAGEDQVRVTRETSAAGGAVQPVAVALGVKQSSDQQFGLGVLAADPGHVPAAPLGGQLVGHGLVARQGPAEPAALPTSNGC